MQESFGFMGGDIAAWRTRLGPVVLPGKRRTPAGQLVKSLISARTRDAVSLAAYRRLGARFGSVARIARAEPKEVLAVIGDVTFAEAKAGHLISTLRQIAAEDGGFELDHLATRPLGEALTWLERLPGVARKVAASTLNASTIGRPVMIVDTHVLRVLHRLGFVAATADYRAASETVTAAVPGWRGDDFLSLHIALKRLGQALCRWDEPVCGACPLAADCPTGRIAA